jgi:hypothetical protein
MVLALYLFYKLFLLACIMEDKDYAMNHYIKSLNLNIAQIIYLKSTPEIKRLYNSVLLKFLASAAFSLFSAILHIVNLFIFF